MKFRKKNKRFPVGIEKLETRTFLSASDLDTTFNLTGISTIPATGVGQDIAYASAFQSDGKLLVAGNAVGQGKGQYIAVSRYTTAGALDTTFGTGGKDLITINTWAEAKAITVQADGKILLAGGSGTDQYNHQPIVVRLTATGALDTTFNSTGYDVFGPASQPGELNSIALQSDGKIVTGGWTTSATSLQNDTVARLTTAGALDSSYGAGGMVITPVTNTFTSHDAVNGITVDSSGRVVAAGQIGTATASKFGVMRYTTAGALDTTFGSGGILQIQVGGIDIASGVVIQSDGKLVIGGTSGTSFAAVRCLATGELDDSYGNNSGHLIITNATDQCTSMAMLSTGSVVLAGTTVTSGVGSFMAVRLTSAGALDTTFHSTGKAVFGTNESGFAISSRSTGVIDLVGESTTNLDFNIYQVTSAGAADTTFGSSGLVATDFTVPMGSLSNLAYLQSDGKLVTVGFAYAGSSPMRQFMVRHNPNGTLDTTFGTGGIATIPIINGLDVTAIAEDASGRILVGGHSLSGSVATAAVQRYTAGGALDTTFGTSGTTSLTALNASSSNNYVADILVESDGSLLLMTNSSISGYFAHLLANGQIDTNYGPKPGGLIAVSDFINGAALDPSGRVVFFGNHAIARYSVNGVYDSTFNRGQPPATIDASALNDAFAFQPDGKILVVGQTTSGNPSVMRLNANGSNDIYFGTTLTGVASLPGGFDAMALHLLSDGSIVAAGEGGDNQNIGDVAELTASGTPLTTFGTGGIATFANAAFFDMTVDRDGHIDLAGDSNRDYAVFRLVGATPNVILGSPGNDTITLSTETGYIDWTLTPLSGRVPNGAAQQLTILGNGGSDSINAAALPTNLTLQGTFTFSQLDARTAFANTNLDITNSTLFLPYTASTTDPLSQLRALLNTGYNGGAWNHAGVGAIRSSTAMNDSTHTTGIGYADSADGLVPLPANTIELKYTLYGDTGLTGSVGFTDFMRMTQHYTLTGQTWGGGDFNYDGTVDVNDFNLQQPNYGQTLPAPAPVMTPIVVAPVAPPPPAPVDPTPAPPTVVTNPPKVKKHSAKAPAVKKHH